MDNRRGISWLLPLLPVNTQPSINDNNDIKLSNITFIQFCPLCSRELAHGETLDQHRQSWHIQKITDQLYLSDWISTRNVKDLELNGITHILNVAKEIKDPDMGEEIEVKNRKVEYLAKYHWKWTDTDEPILAYLRPIVKKLNSVIKESSSNHVLVHCMMGISRSASVILAYFIVNHKWSYDQAFEHVVKLAPQINPNPSYQNQLRQLAGLK
jgi:atypical dual specificity phosphatase